MLESRSDLDGFLQANEECKKLKMRFSNVSQSVQFFVRMFGSFTWDTGDDWEAKEIGNCYYFFYWSRIEILFYTSANRG